MTPEGKVVEYLKRRAKEQGGTTRKVAWVGHTGAPDQLVLLPGIAAFVECKAPGKKPTKVQEREITRLKSSGLEVYVVDSELSVDQVLAWLTFVGVKNEG